MCQLGQSQGGERGLSGGLGDSGAAHGQRRAHLPGNHGGREVPGRDQTADTNRLLHGDDTVSGHTGGNGLAVDSGGLLTEPFEEVGGVRDLALGVGEGLAVLPSDQGG